MGWFEEQVKERKKLDEKTFEASFMSLAGLHVDNPQNLSQEELRENYVIKQILSRFRLPTIDIPPRIKKFEDKLNYSLRESDVRYQKIELNDSYVNDTNSPILIFTLVNNIPVLLFPIGNKSYYYINYRTGKKVTIKASVVNGLEMEAYSFYRPLPNKKISIKDYITYLRKSIRISDIVLLVLFSALAAGVGLLLPYLTKILTGDIAKSDNYNKLALFSIYIASTAVGVLLINAVKQFVIDRISIRIEKAVQQATLARVLNLPASFFKKYKTGELTSRMNNVVSLANGIVNGVFVVMVSFVMSLAYLFQLVGFAPVLILPVILILLTTSVLDIISAFVQKKHTSKELHLVTKEVGVTYEMINGIQKIRLSGSEKRVFAKWASYYSKAARVQYRPPLLLRLGPALTLLITLLGNILIYVVASINKLDASSYMAFTATYGVLSAAFASLNQIVNMFSTIKPTFEMARPILEAEPENNQGKEKLESIKGNIKLENVSFKYSENGPLIIDKLNLEIKEGEYLAVVGSTGCGKSTLVRLLLGFEKPIEGHITYDDIDIDNVDLTSLRRNIGTVMQNGTLFHADIFSNIIISSPNLKEEDAWRAAEIADIAKDIKQMPMGMKTVISEGQGGISGGQKQRIMIARAIVHKPKILIFDEATSALDNKTQKSISDSINKLNCTRIVIAHRLSTIKNADRIIMIEGGKIIEEGSYQSLIDKKGKFAELVDRQRLDN